MPLRNGHLTTLLNCTMCCSTSPIRGRVVEGCRPRACSCSSIGKRRGSGDEMLRFHASRDQLADKIRRLALNSKPEDSQTIISLATDVITRGGADVRPDFSQTRPAGQPDEGADPSFQSERLGRVSAVLQHAPMAFSALCGGPKHKRRS